MTSLLYNGNVNACATNPFGNTATTSNGGGSYAIALTPGEASNCNVITSPLAEKDADTGDFDPPEYVSRQFVGSSATTCNVMLNVT